MNTVLITTSEDSLAPFFWNSFFKHKDERIRKVILLPSRDEVDFPLLLKPLIALKMLGVFGVLKLISTKLFMERVDFKKVAQECVELDTRSSKSLFEELARCDVDVLISVGAPVIFKEDLLSVPSLCALNLHNGDINRYRGHFSSFWEIVNGEDRNAITLHEMNKEVDSGIIYDQVFENRANFSSFWELMKWKKVKGGEMLARSLCSLEETKTTQRVEFQKADRSVGKYYGFPQARDVLRFRFRQ